MVFRNAFKVACSRANLVFKLIAYELIVLVLFLAIAACILLPNFNETMAEINALNIGQEFTQFLSEISTGSSNPEAWETFYEVLGSAVRIFRDGFIDKAFWLVALLCLVMKFVLGLRDYPAADILYSFMSENSDYSFSSNFINNFPKSVRFSFWNALFSLPFDMLLIAFVYYVVGWLFSVVSIFAPFFIVLIVLALIAFRNTLFFSWLPCIIIGKQPTVKAFFKSVNFSFRNFWQIFAVMSVFCTLVFMILMVSLSATFGVAVIFVAPFALVVQRSFELVKYASMNKLRFYTEPGVVVQPAVVEIELVKKEDEGEDIAD